MPARLTFDTASPEQTHELGRALAAVLREGDVLALDGPLGAGKTALVRGIAAGLGLDASRVSSPTFVVVAEHAAPGAPTLIHADAYRLSGPDELDSLGWERVLDGTGIAAVEWARRLEDRPASTAGPRASPLGEAAFVAHLTIEPVGPQARRFALDAPETWPLRRGWSTLAAWASEGGERPCPVCGRPVRADASTWPFHDAACRWADLSRWFSGEYTVSRQLEPDEEPPA